ncbi:hypothetical protein, partial [Microcoleus sp. CAWBG640]|uniref:hypothetical protein n=1 Tax=Microcoleus sp. CAWBG640 TaxID=2841653 RepID=UPI00312BA804
DGKCLRATVVPDSFFQAKRSQCRNFYPIASHLKYWSIAAVYSPTPTSAASLTQLNIPATVTTVSRS